MKEIKELIMATLKPAYWYCMTMGDRDLKRQVYSLFYPLIKEVEQDKKMEVKK
jgi:hypothetical protein